MPIFLINFAIYFNLLISIRYTFNHAPQVTSSVPFSWRVIQFDFLHLIQYQIFSEQLNSDRVPNILFYCVNYFRQSFRTYLMCDPTKEVDGVANLETVLLCWRPRDYLVNPDKWYFYFFWLNNVCFYFFNFGIYFYFSPWFLFYDRTCLLVYRMDSV